MPKGPKPNSPKNLKNPKAKKTLTYQAKIPPKQPGPEFEDDWVKEARKMFASKNIQIPATLSKPEFDEAFYQVFIHEFTRENLAREWGRDRGEQDEYDPPRGIPKSSIAKVTPPIYSEICVIAATLADNKLKMDTKEKAEWMKNEPQVDKYGRAKTKPAG